MVNAKNRMEQLKALGLSAGVLHLASGKEGQKPGSLFGYRCNEPYAIFDEDSELPTGGSDLIPLWEWNATSYYAVWEHDGRREFIRFHLERPDEYKVVAYSEQGLLAHLFSQLIEANEAEDGPEQRLRDAAKQVQFERLDELLAFRKNNTGGDYPEELAEFTRQMK